MPNNPTTFREWQHWRWSGKGKDKCSPTEAAVKSVPGGRHKEDSRELKQEKSEHPWMSEDQAAQVVEDHEHRKQRK